MFLIPNFANTIYVRSYNLVESFIGLRFELVLPLRFGYNTIIEVKIRVSIRVWIRVKVRAVLFNYELF